MPYARNGDVQLWYERFGSPSDAPLLLINGLGSQCINYRTEWCDRFAGAGFHVIRFDNRDVGLSTSFDDAGLSQAYTLSDMAADAVAVLDAVGVDRAHVMGLSMGGMIAQTMAIEHPHRLRSLVSVMSSTGDADVGSASPEAMEVFRSPAGTDRESAIARHLAGIRVWGSPACFDEERIRREVGEAFDRRFNPAGVARQVAAIAAASSRTEALRQVRVPTLVLHGSEDKLIDPSGGRRTAEAIPGARFVLLEGMGHDYPPEYWDQWVALVAEHARAADTAAADA